MDLFGNRIKEIEESQAIYLKCSQDFVCQMFSFCEGTYICLKYYVLCTGYWKAQL